MQQKVDESKKASSQSEKQYAEMIGHEAAKWYESLVPIAVHWKQIVHLTEYRIVHTQGIADMKDISGTGNYSPTHPMTLRRIKEDLYEIVDGAHRFFAMQEIIRDRGVDVWKSSWLIPEANLQL